MEFKLIGCDRFTTMWELSEGWQATLHCDEPGGRYINLWKRFDCRCLDHAAGESCYQEMTLRNDGALVIEPACCYREVILPSDVTMFIMMALPEITRERWALESAWPSTPSIPTDVEDCGRTCATGPAAW